MKLAIISTYPPKKCGIAIHTKNIVNVLSKEHRIEIITFKGYNYNDKRTKPILEKSNMFSYIKTIYYIKKQKFDIVLIDHEYVLYSLTFFPIFLMLLKLTKTKINIIMHTIACYKGIYGLCFLIYHKIMFLSTDILFIHTNIAQKKLRGDNN